MTAADVHPVFEQLALTCSAVYVARHSTSTRTVIAARCSEPASDAVIVACPNPVCGHRTGDVLCRRHTLQAATDDYVCPTCGQPLNITTEEL